MATDNVVPCQPFDGWRPEYVLFCRVLIDGTRARGWLMHRRVNGRSEYRHLTDEEVEVLRDAEAW